MRLNFEVCHCKGLNSKRLYSNIMLVYQFIITDYHRKINPIRRKKSGYDTVLDYQLIPYKLKLLEWNNNLSSSDDIYNTA